MENTRCFANRFSDYSALLPGQGAEAAVPVVVASIDKILQTVPIDLSDCDGGLYDGPAEVAYMLYHVSECPLFSEYRDVYLKTAKQIIDMSVRYVDAEPDKNMRAAFLLGVRSDPFSGVRLFVGRTGYLCAALVLKQKLGIEILSKDQIKSICQAIIESGKQYARKKRKPFPLMYSYYGTEYLGKNHQLRATFSALVIKVCKCTDIRIFHSFSPLTTAGASVNHPAMMFLSGDNLLGWLQGYKGLLFYLLLFPCVDVCLSSGHAAFTLCFYVSTFLFCPHRFAEFLFTEEFKAGSRSVTSIYSLFEGLSGTVCFLVDLLQPDQSEFPLFSVFV
uniref:LanC like family member 3 n=1 Tax=Neolamprologus brichardi TaxID=32507 RepID=A0A3Q4GE54_NEOBR